MIFDHSSLFEYSSTELDLHILHRARLTHPRRIMHLRVYYFHLLATWIALYVFKQQYSQLVKKFTQFTVLFGIVNIFNIY